MRSQWWLGGTTPQAWRVPVAAFAAGALLSAPAVASASPVDPPPFAHTAPDFHLGREPARLDHAPTAGLREAGARPAALTGLAPGPRADAVLSLRAAAVSRRSGQLATASASPGSAPRRIADTAFDGMLVAAIGTGLACAGWLLMLAASRRLRRRSR
jgi:hypothetical protein